MPTPAAVDMTGTRERKRKDRATPPPSSRDSLAQGCVVASAVAAVLLSVVFWKTLSWGAGLPAFVLAIALGVWGIRRLYGYWLLSRVQREWSRRGVRCLVVHSDSPIWSDHIRQNWWPRLDAVAEKVNWSERSRWRNALAVRVFQHFVVQPFNFNPAVAVFRGLRRPLVYRFYYAFHEASHGRHHYLAELEAAMLKAVNGQDSAA